MVIKRQADKYSERFKNIGLINRNGGTPQYLSKVGDPNSINGEIYFFNDVDINITNARHRLLIRLMLSAVPSLSRGNISYLWYNGFDKINPRTTSRAFELPKQHLLTDSRNILLTRRSEPAGRRLSTNEPPCRPASAS